MRTTSARSRASRRPLWIPLLAASRLIVACSACSSARPPAAEREYRAERGGGDVVVAAVWAWRTRADILFRQGLDLAAEEINASGGIGGRQVRLLYDDDRESVTEGSLVAQRLVNNPDVVAVIGHLQSYVAVPAATIYELGGILFVSPTSTSADLTSRGYTRVFRTTFVDHDVGHRMAQFAARRRYRRVGIYYVRNAYGRSLANAFEERATELGITVAQRTSYEPGPSFTPTSAVPTLRQWKQLELDALFVAGQVPEAAALIAEARRVGITAPILGGDAMGAQSLITGGGAAVEGVVVPAPFHRDDQRPEVRRFVRAFERRFGQAPDVGAALAYDALTLLAHAMRQAGSVSPGRVAAALRALRPWPAVSGDVRFTARGDLIEPRIIKTVVRNGRFEYLEEPAAVADRSP